VERGKAVAQSELSELEPRNGPGVFRDWLGWIDIEEVAGDDGQRKEQRTLHARQLGPDAQRIGDPVSLGREPDGGLQPCYMDEGVAFYGHRGGKFVVWFLSAKGFSKAVETTLPKSFRAWGPECSGGRLTRAWAVDDRDPKFGTLSCTSAGCQVEEGKLEGGLAIWRRVAVLGNRTLALYQAKTDDLRLRVASTQEIAQAPPTVVMDSFDYSGPKFDNHRVLLARDYALLHFDDEENHHAVVLKADGTVSPVAVQ
jgi:hypothetical protein